MEKMLDLITGEVTKAFIACGYDEKYARVTLSNRPDLCEYQCNGALAAAKEYHCAPFMISDKVAEELKQSEMFESVDSGIFKSDLIKGISCILYAVYAER